MVCDKLYTYFHNGPLGVNYSKPLFTSGLRVEVHSVAYVNECPSSPPRWREQDWYQSRHVYLSLQVLFTVDIRVENRCSFSQSDRMPSSSLRWRQQGNTWLVTRNKFYQSMNWWATMRSVSLEATYKVFLQFSSLWRNDRDSDLWTQYIIEEISIFHKLPGLN